MDKAIILIQYCVINFMLLNFVYFLQFTYTLLHVYDYTKYRQECATFFLESSREKIKHAIAALLVEILYPVAAVINVEASLPVIKRFVSMLYTHCFEQARKGRHSTQTVSVTHKLCPAFLCCCWKDRKNQKRQLKNTYIYLAMMVYNCT